MFKPKKINKSILAEDEVKQVLITCYPLIFNSSNSETADIQVTLLCCGVNDTYKVLYNNRAYTYRIYNYNWKSPEAIKAEMRMLDRLRITMCSDHYPFNVQNKDWITPIKLPEGIRYGILLNFVDGDIPVGSMQLTSLMGEQLAELHDALDLHPIEHAFRKINKNFLINQPLVQINQLLKRLNLNFTDRLNTLLFKLDSLSYFRLNLGLCHGDAQINNIIVKNSHIDFIDFDLCGYGPRIYDIATFLWKIEMRSELQKEKQLIQIEFLRGYEKVRPLTEEEKVAIPILMAWRHVFWLGAQAQLMPNILGHVIFSKDYFNTHIGWLEKWCTNGSKVMKHLLLTEEITYQDFNHEITSLQQQWTNKQRGILITLLQNEADLAKSILQISHIYAADNLIAYYTTNATSHNQLQLSVYQK